MLRLAGEFPPTFRVGGCLAFRAVVVVVVASSRSPRNIPPWKHLYERRISESCNTQRFARPAAATTNGEFRVTGPTPSLHRLSRLIIWRARSCHLQCTRPVAAKNKRRRRLADRAHILGTIDLFETEMYVAEHMSSLSEAWLVLLQTFMRVVVCDGTICAVDQCSAFFFFILPFVTKDKKHASRSLRQKF